MNKNIRQKDLSNAEKRMYNQLSLNPKIKIDCATDCDAALDDSHRSLKGQFVFFFFGIIFAIPAVFHVFADQFFWGIFLFFSALSALFTFTAFEHKKKHLVQLPRAIMAYKNERFGDEENAATEKSS